MLGCTMQQMAGGRANHDVCKEDLLLLLGSTVHVQPDPYNLQVDEA